MADILLDVKVQGTQDVIKAERALVKVQNSAKRLATEMDKGRLSSQAYFKGQTQLVSALTKAGFSYKEARDAVFQYTKAMRASDVAVDQMVDNLNRATAAQNNLNNASQRSTRGIGQMSTMVQQSGYQIGDFLVQVQSGTNWMVAFGQQATQVAGTLTLFGGKMIAIGTALGIAIPLLTALGAAWMRTRESTDGLADELSRIDKELEKLAQTAEAFSKGMTLDEFFATNELSRVQSELQSIREVYQEISAESIGRSLLGAIPGAAALGLDDAAKIVELLGLEEEALERIAKLEEKIAAERKRQFEEDLQSYQDRITLRRLEITFGEDSDRARSEALEQRIDAMKREYNRMVETGKVTAEMAEKLKESAEQAMRLEGIDLESGVAKAAQAARTLAANMGITLSAAQGLVALGATPDNKFMQLYNSGAFGGTPNVSGFRSAEYHNLLDKINNPSAYGAGSSGGGISPTEQAEEYLQKLERESEFKRSLVGLSDEQAAIETRREQLVNQLNGYEEGLSDTYTQRIEQIIKTEAETRKLMEAEQQREQLMNTIEGHIENAFMSMVDGSKSVEDAFRSMLRNIILAVYQQQVAKPAATAIGSLISKVIPSFDGGGFTGYGPRGGGLDGKGGKLAMVHPNETVIDHTKGQSMGNVTVVQNFNMSANGDESVKRIIRQETPRIAEQAKAAVVDAKRRGGSYGRSF